MLTGLELVRNCETHSPMSLDELLVLKREYSVPLHGGGQVMRSVWHSADILPSVPSEYVDLVADAPDKQVRARKEAQHGYRTGVQGRSFVETLLDAEQFFVGIEPRLASSPVPRLLHPFAVVPQGEATVLHRPLEGFVPLGSTPGPRNPLGRAHHRGDAAC